MRGSCNLKANDSNKVDLSVALSPIIKVKGVVGKAT
jgi:hypothetical protein